MIESRGEKAMQNIKIMIILIIIFALSSCGKDKAIIPDLDVTDFEEQEFVNDQGQKNNVPKTEENIILDTKNILKGTWHHLPVVGAVLGSRYHFFGDMKYIFEYSQFDISKRVLSDMGNWDVVDDILTLVVDRRIIVEDGELVEASPYASSDFEIINGLIRIVELNPSEKEEHDISGILIDSKEKGNELWTVVINNIQFWKLSDNPEAYQNDPVEDGDVWNPS
jgi:predicted small lipoprotein YifL